MSPVADPGGGGGVQGVRTPPFGPRCRLFNIGPKVGPPPFVNVQEWGCFSNFLRSDDVTRTMSKGGGVLVKNLVSVPGPPLSKILDPRLVSDRVSSASADSLKYLQDTQPQENNRMDKGHKR